MQAYLEPFDQCADTERALPITYFYHNDLAIYCVTDVLPYRNQQK